MIESLLHRHQPTDLVAFGEGGERTAAHLLLDAAAIAESLPPAADDSHVLLVFQADRYAFTTALLGAWAAGHAVALPPNTRRDSVLLVFERPNTVALVHDTDSGKAIRIPPFAFEPSDAPPLERVSLPARGVIATVFTSGSQGHVTACPKSAKQLFAEATVLATAFDLEPGDHFVATVQPGHIYGLLFSVLAPLLSGGAFLRETPFHAEAIAERVRAHRARVLVTVPAHLRGLGALQRGSMASLGRVFSSTAPLLDETAHAFVAAHDQTITEILGSTETGGIASRDRSLNEAWKPLPGVEVEIDDEGTLWVNSPFNADSEGAVRTADLAKAQPDGTFVHLGRSDGIVKIGGRRVSLQAMERWFLTLPGVQDACVVAVPAMPGRDTQILAAVVAQGTDPATMREGLSSRFASSVLPRRIVLVDALPREENGKLQPLRVLRLFGLNAEGAPIRWTFDWIKDERDDASEDGRLAHRFFVHVPQTHGAFEGHFPGYPIMPAAFQLGELVLPCVRKARPELGELRGLKKLKFLGRIVPGDDLEVEIAWRAEEPSIDFALRRDKTICSGGKAVFSGDEP